MSTVKHEVGEFYWRAWHDEETGKVELEQYGLRSIRKGTAYFTLKSDGFTWGKRSTKAGDYGWLDPVPAIARMPHRLGSDTIRMYAKTQASALRTAIAAERRSLVRYRGDAEAEAECHAAIEAFQRRLKRVDVTRPTRRRP